MSRARDEGGSLLQRLVPIAAALGGGLLLLAFDSLLALADFLFKRFDFYAIFFTQLVDGGIANNLTCALGRQSAFGDFADRSCCSFFSRFLGHAFRQVGSDNAGEQRGSKTGGSHHA